MTNLTLRNYQIEAIESINLERYGSGLIDSATGSGKTVIFCKVIHDRALEGHRCLVIVHRDHLVRQVIDTFDEFFPNIRVGIVRGKEREWDAPVVVASIMTATNDVADVMPVDFDLVVTDEAHRAVTPSYFRLYQRLNLISEKVFEELVLQAGEDDIKFQKSERVRKDAYNQMESMTEDDPDRDVVRSQMRQEVRGLHQQFNMARGQQTAILNLDGACEGITPDLQPRKHIGFTATAQRTDELGLGVLFTDVYYTCKMRDLVSQNQLCDLRVLPVSFRCNKTELRAMLRDGLADSKIVNLWKEHASDRKSTIAFCMNIAHAEHLAQAFRDAEIDAEAIHSKLPMEQRLKIEERFRRGELKVLTNVNIFIEGFNVEFLDCVIMARDTDSATLIPQALGRGTRIHPGKEDCLVLDIGKTIDIDVLSKTADIFRSIKYGSDANPSGFDGIRETRAGEDHEMFAGAFIELAKMIEESDDSLSWVPYQKIGGQSLNLSRNEWISIGEHRDDPNQYAAAYEKNGARSLICKGKESIHVCKDESLRWLLDNKMEHLIRSRDAEWRMNKATRTQIAILQKHGVDVTQDATRGECSDFIALVLRNAEKS